MRRVLSLWVCYTTEVVLQNGFVLKSRTHTAGDFGIGGTPAPDYMHNIQQRGNANCHKY